MHRPFIQWVKRVGVGLPTRKRAAIQPSQPTFLRPPERASRRRELLRRSRQAAPTWKFSGNKRECRGMEIIPAVDILGGRCVRLLRGNYDRRTVYDDDPVRAARTWEEQGARRLHVVDLDGAKTGRMRNWKTICSILRKTTCRVEIGGGVRDERTAGRLLDAGADRVIVGTAVFSHPKRFRAMMRKFTSRLWLSVDVRGSGLMLQGWTSAAGVTLNRFIRDAESWPVGGMVLTSILKDGALRGPDLSMARKTLAVSRKPVILSGGISSLAHIRAVSRMGAENIAGLIIGKALYEKKFTLKQAMGASR